MSLIHEFERSGNLLFRYRGQIPVVFFLLATPVLLLTSYDWMTPSHSTWVMLISFFLTLAGIGIRAYTIGTTPAGTSGRNTDKQVAEQLNTTGIYSSVRHPLYLGNYLMWAGLLLFTAQAWFFVVISLVFWIYYERIMFAEEAFLRVKYGEAYTAWASRTPAFIPRLHGWKKSSVSFSWISVLRREYSGWLAQAIGYAYIDLLRQWNMHAELDPRRVTVVILGSFLIITLVLRTLKHHTGVLRESGRS